MAEHVVLTGGYYDVGFQLGQQTAGKVHAILWSFKSSPIYTKITEFLDADQGRDVVSTMDNTVRTYCAVYVKELEGLATGAGVKYQDLFLFNCNLEFAALFEDVTGASHDVKYASLYDGCTNISMTTTHGNVLLAHTEDISPVAKDLGIMLSVEIIDDEGRLAEKWIDYCIPGILSGSKFSFSSHGIMLGGNHIDQKGINIKGIPRRFMCRSLLKVRSSNEAVDRLTHEPGIATAFCFHYLQRTDQGIDNTVVEVAGTPEGSRVQVYRPSSFYHHCNMFQHLRYPCHPGESSVHRAAVLSQYVNRGEIHTKEHLMSAISNQQDPVFPVYRTGQFPDCTATGATGIFDATSGTLEVYTDVPARSRQNHVFSVP